MFLQTRREFLLTGLKGAGLLAASAFVPTFLTRTAAAAGADKDATVLVVLQLSGGNDGLNTVIPFTDDLYYKARPTLGLRGESLLKISDRLALNAALQPLRDEFGQGRFAIIQNTGYPNPNRSHFRSMEIWQTGVSERPEQTGWLGRYFDAQCCGSDPKKPKDPKAEAEIGISIGKVMPQAFRNRSNVGLSVNNPDTFQWNASGETEALAKMQEAIFEKLNRPRAVAMSPSPTSLANLGGVVGSEPETANFLRHIAMNAIAAGDQIRGVLDKRQLAQSFPDTQLGHDLSIIAKLIAGDFPTRVYYATQRGFDTHSHQKNTHAQLLGEVAESLAAFLGELRKQKISQRVLVVAFSEFGRRVAENGSEGTDHGTAAPMFLFGDAVKGGIHGGLPDLQNLSHGDLRHQVDFRQVYAAVLQGWLKTDSAAILGGEYPPLGLLV